MNRPYRCVTSLDRRGRRFQTPQSGVLPLVALAPKGVRYLDDPPFPYRISRREQAFKRRKRRVSPLTGFVTPPYRFAPFPHRRGRRFQTPQSGVLPLVALTPKGVRYLDDPPFPDRISRREQAPALPICTVSPPLGRGLPSLVSTNQKPPVRVILEQSEGSADGFLHFLLSIIFYLFSII